MPTNRILKITPVGILDKLMTYDEYLSDARVKAQREERSAEAVVRSGGVVSPV